MTPPWIAWATAPAAAALIAFYLWRGRLPGRLLADALAVGVTLGSAVAMALAPFELKTNPLHFSATTLAFGFAGLPEEGVKMLGVAAFLRPHWLARGRRDVVFAAGALSLGFASLENIFYLANANAGWATLAVERALMAMPFHVFLGLAGGFVVASARPGLKGLALGVAGWLALAAIHGVYDFAVFAGAPGAQAPAVFPRLVAALGWDAAATLRALLAGAEAAAAVAAGAAVAALPPPVSRKASGRLVRLARARAWSWVVGLPLAGGAALALGGGVVAAVMLESPAALFDVALYAVSPLALGALFLAEPAPKRAALSARGRRVLTGAGVAAALALGAAAVVWGPPAQRWLSAIGFEARGARLAAGGDYPRAVEAFTRALAAEPGRIAALSQRAAAYAAENRFAPALADLDAALRVAPGNIALYAQRADIDRQRNDPAAAAADLDAALKLKAGDPELLALRGQARLEAGDSKGAYADLAEASRTAPDDGLVRRVFAAWDVDAGDFDAAIRDLNARLHAAPADPLALFQRGRVWLYKREPRRALDDLARADQTAAAGLYPALWRFLAQARLGIDGAPDLRQRLAAAPGKWPAPVARMFLGEIDSQAARGLATDDDERCEADYYFAALRLDKDPAADSAARLHAARAECPTDFIEYEGAKAELRRLAR